MSTAWRTPLLAITSKRTIKALPSFDFTWKGWQVGQLQKYIQETKNQMATRNSPGNKEICQKPDTHNSIKRWQWEKIPKETNQMLAINTSREAEKWAKNEIHLDKFVSRGWDLLSGSSLEVGHTRWDVLALPSKWWKLWWFYDYADFLSMKIILNVPASWCPAPRAWEESSRGLPCLQATATFAHLILLS